LVPSMILITRRDGVPGGNGQAQGRWVEWLGDVRRHGGFALYGQPIVDLRSGRALRHELLLRLVEDGESIPNGDFLAAAERRDRIEEIDRWVVGRAVKLAAAGPVNVNLTCRSITPAFVEHLEGLLDADGADPANLALELSEPELTEAGGAGRDFLWKLYGLGCGVAVDVFGTGPAEVHHLRSLPPGYWKLGDEFVRDLPRDRDTRGAVAEIVWLARMFGSRTVAVGVKDLATLQILEELGADQAQGSAFGRPIPAAQLAASGDL
jgi:EAL domain-containing protein (putative c-di-GMP-specific phosphodiesterase class I)